MKVSVLVIACVFIAMGCSEDITSHGRAPGMVNIKIVTEEWSGWGCHGQNNKLDSCVVTVRKGEEFGPTNYIGSGGAKPFKFLRPINSHTIVVSFSDNLVVIGEPISRESEKNPIIITDERVCFRTRTHDAGMDICLEIVH